VSQNVLDRCLLLDLETSFDQRILKIGAVWRDRTFVYPQGGSLADALAELDSFAAGAELVLGHNVLDHDLAILARQAPGLALLRKPVVDTLYLSPLAFPENPYHRLVKGYKLVRDTVNDPVADARLAARLFADAWHSLAVAAGAEPDLAAFYAFCLQSLPGLCGALTGLAGRPPLAVAEARAFVARSCRGQACAAALAERAEAELAHAEARPAWGFAVAWLRVAGGRSVVPHWVAARHPHTLELLDALRGRPCAGAACAYCSEHHSLEAQLALYFAPFSSFRALPAAADGGSLQRAVAARCLAGEPLLAMLPTGSGKSLCYQLPALIRHRRRGQLTIVISPLQALMQDQVERLNDRTGLDSAAAINGLLTPPERGAVLEKVRLGGVAVLYAAPEQLRNRSFLQAIEQREVAAWVFDEAHCLSKWGHDFRPDYLYASRCIRELARRQNRALPAIACFTATARPDVASEIREHFRAELHVDLAELGSNLRRPELRFSVEAVAAAAKLARVHALAAEELAAAPGAAVVAYFATRDGAERAAAYLAARGLAAAAFHAGLSPPDKRRVQQAFTAGTVPVVCATNAFGMGIDKENVRLVVHGDLPGSLESYLQEAGRAGRDGQAARCILLFAAADVERQFRLAAASRLSLRDIAQVLRGVRQLARKQRGAAAGEVVVTSGELLGSGDVETSFAAGDRDADTKVKIAVAWLERAQLLERSHNRTRVFQGRPRIASLELAARRIDQQAPGLGAAERQAWLAILAALINCRPDEGLTADQLVELPALATMTAPATASVGDGGGRETAGEAVLRILDRMVALDLIESGMQLTAYLKRRGPGAAAELGEVESAMLEVLAARPPAAAAGVWQEVSLRWLSQTLRDRGLRAHPETLRRLLVCLAREGAGEPGRASLLALAWRSRDQCGLRLPAASWQGLIEVAARRRVAAGCVLGALLAKTPVDGPAAATVQVAFAVADLVAALGADPEVGAGLGEPAAVAERALLRLHDLEVIQLQQGLAVFRQAMTLRLLPRGPAARYSRADYQPLRAHYRQRTLQIHVMARYAEIGLEDIDGALDFVDAYFSLQGAAFTRRYFPGESAMLVRATGRESYRRIVESLGNAAQTALVTARAEASLLVLAGPGSGKTRAVVHRCGYLLRVERVPASAILVVCFNRSAAREVSRRLRQLVGDDARGVLVQTYHGLALRLTGTSLAAASQAGTGEPDFARLIDEANELLRQGAAPAGSGAVAAGAVPVAQEPLGSVPVAPEPLESAPEGPAGLLRDRILAGFSHILVDEYQDINEAQYELIGHLAGRRENDAERRLPILAVGDDDQTIYGWNGASIEFLRRFRQDHPDAAVHFLVENFRSTAHIVACADHLIRHNRHRLKQGQAARVDSARAGQPAGGSWAAAHDPAGSGRVRLLRVAGAGAQAAAVVEHLRALRRLDPQVQWRQCAVLARTRRELEPIRALCESAGLPVVWAADRDKLPPLHRVREIASLLGSLEARRGELVRASWLLDLAAAGAAQDVGAVNPWRATLGEILREWQDETADAEVPASAASEFLFDALAERRREPVRGQGIYLGTVHSAKGLEFAHVVLADGGWAPASHAGSDSDGDDAGADAVEAERRLYYVGMTRACHTLALLARRDQDNPQVRLIEAGAAVAGSTMAAALAVSEPVVVEPPEELLERRFVLLGLGELFLDFAGRRLPGDPTHAALERLRPDDLLTARLSAGWVELLDAAGIAVASLSLLGRQAVDRAVAFEPCRVVALVERRAADSQSEYRPKLRCERWWVPVVEARFRAAPWPQAERCE
jgi:ATP-dependent DNA helicase RecQ